MTSPAQDREGWVAASYKPPPATFSPTIEAMRARYFMLHDPERKSDGPAVLCPGKGVDEACVDYPNGACDACMEKAEQEPNSPAYARARRSEVRAQYQQNDTQTARFSQRGRFIVNSPDLRGPR